MTLIPVIASSGSSLAPPAMSGRSFGLRRLARLRTRGRFGVPLRARRFDDRFDVAPVGRRRLQVFFFNVTPTTEIYTLSLHDALPISRRQGVPAGSIVWRSILRAGGPNSLSLVCRARA